MRNMILAALEVKAEVSYHFDYRRVHYVYIE